MSRVLTNEQNYYDIADTIRQMKNVNTTYKPREMASALKDIYSNEVEGVPPLSFEANGNNLLNYRIDGASGGVGDRTSNLVDKTKFIYGYRLSNIGTLYTTPSEQNLFAVSEFIEVNSGEQYIISQRDATRGYARRISFYQSKNENSWLSNNDDSDLIFTVPNTATYLKFTTLQNYIDSIMLIRGTSLPTTYEPYGYKVPVMVEGKNLLQNTATSTTTNGVTFTVNNDGSVTCNGTPNSGIYSDLLLSGTLYGEKLIIEYGNYILSNIGSSSALVAIIGNGTHEIGRTRGNDVTFTDDVSWVLLRCYGVEEPQTVYPMIRLASIEDDTYEPYIESTTTNIYLDEPIEENESVSLSDTNTNIPTLDGTNTLSIGTTVQPSNVYIQAPKDSIEATQIANRLEVI